LRGHAVNHFAPKLVRHAAIELSLAHAVLSPRWNRSAGAGPGKPQPMKVALGKSHGRVKTDHRKEPRNVKDGLNHLLANGGIQVVELRSIVPGKAGAIIAVVN